IDIHAGAAAARPGFELDIVQVRYVMGADDVETFAADPARIGSLLLGGEFLRQLVGDDCGLGHTSPHVRMSTTPMAATAEPATRGSAPRPTVPSARPIACSASVAAMKPAA